MDRLFGMGTLMQTLGYNSNKTYDAYWNRIMTLVEQQGLNIVDAEWAQPQSKFTYEMLELQEKITAMATYVSISSEPLPVGAQAPLEKLTGSIPRQRVLVRRTEEDYRNQINDLNDILAVADLKNINSTMAVREYLEGYLFDTQSPIAEGHKNSINYAIGQVKCKAKVVLNDTNNPRGIRGVEFAMHVPEENFSDYKWFTRDSNGKVEPVTGVDPVKVIAEKLLEIKWKYYDGFKLRMDEEYAYHLLHHPDVLSKLGYYINPALRLSSGSKADAQASAVAADAKFDVLKEAFRQAVGADEVEYYNTVCGVDILDKEEKVYKTQRLKAFDFGVISISPLGNIISIKNVQPLRPDGSAISAEIFGGYGLVEYRYDAKMRTQEWISELTALPVLTRPKDMYYFNTVADAEVSSESAA